MSTTIDNITLALLSLKSNLQTYLDSNGWKNKISVFLEGDESIRRKEFVEKVTNMQTQIALPVIVIESGGARNEVEELGNESGTDLLMISFLVKGLDVNQHKTLGHLVRRYLNNLSYNVYDYRLSTPISLGIAEFENVMSNDISDYNADIISERYQTIVNSTLRITAQQLI